MAVDKTKLLASAQKHLSKNAVDRALRDLQAIVRDDPKDLRVRQKVAELLARQGQVVDALREFQVVADAYTRGGFFPKAAAIYKQMLRLEPDNTGWHMALGEIYQQLALLSDAADHFDRVAAYFTNNGGARDRIDAFEKLVRLNPDKLEYADQLASQYIKEQDIPSAVDLWAGMARLLEQRGDLDELVQVYERLSTLKPDDLHLVRVTANLYLDRQDPRRALAKLQIAFKSDPQDTETLNLLADAFVDLGETEKAIAVLRELAQIYESLGYTEYQGQVNDRIAELDPRANVGPVPDASLDASEYARAVDGLALADEDDEEDGARRARFEVETLLAYGFADRARAVLDAAVPRFPATYSLHRSMAGMRIAAADRTGARQSLDAMYEIAMDRGDYRAARACLRRAMDIDPGDPSADARLRAFEAAVGDMVLDEPSHLEIDQDDLGAAVELGAQIASVQSEPPAVERTVRTPRAEEPSSDDEEFDDSEMQRLAAELQRELDKDDDPFAGLDDIDLDLPEPKKATRLEVGRKALADGRFDEAIDALTQAVDEEDSLSESLSLLGQAHRRAGDFKSAVDCFRRLITDKLVDGDDQYKALYEIGLTYEEAGNGRSAAKVYKRIVDVRRDFADGDVKRRLASLAESLGPDV